jgi:hypothetical protein
MCCPAHKVERGIFFDGGNFGAGMSFSAWHRMSFTQLVKREADGYMRISNDIHDVVGQGRNPSRNSKDAS